MESSGQGAAGAQRQSSGPTGSTSKGRYRIGLDTQADGRLTATEWLAEAAGSDREKALDAALDGKTTEVFDREGLAEAVEKVDAGEKVEFVVVAVARLAPVPVQITRRRRIG